MLSEEWDLNSGSNLRYAGVGGVVAVNHTRGPQFLLLQVGQVQISDPSTPPDRPVCP